MPTNKPAMIGLPDDMTAMQIDCGTFHTGIYMECYITVVVYIHSLIIVYTCVYSTAVLLHSGDVYVFGHNKHGQLGQGNSKDW